MNHDAWNRGFDAFSENVPLAAVWGLYRTTEDAVEWIKGWRTAAEYRDKIRAGLDFSHAKE